MSNVCKVEFDGDKILDALNTLTDDNYIKTNILIKALKKGGDVLKNKTIEVMKSTLGSTATLTKSDKKPMTNGVRVIVDKDYYEVIVSILKDYRLKWFEKGTSERYTKGEIIGKEMIKKGDGNRERKIRNNNKLYRGSIKGVHFFQTARNQVSDIDNAIISSLDDSFNKLLKNN